MASAKAVIIDGIGRVEGVRIDYLIEMNGMTTINVIGRNVGDADSGADRVGAQDRNDYVTHLSKCVFIL